MRKRTGLLALTATLLAGCSKTPSTIDIAGSSTVYPFTKAVADAFVKANPDAAAPEIRETGTVAGMSTFCAGAARRTSSTRRAA